MVYEPIEVIVIGGGIAGLSAAAHLAQMGKKVRLYEQHEKPGGYYTSFTRNGIIFDITAHWTIAHTKVNKMLAGLGASPVPFAHHPNIGQYFGPGAKGPVLLVHDRERFARSIREAYPAAKDEAIERLIELALQLEGEIGSMELESPELMTLPAKARMLVQAPLKLKTVMKYSKTPGEEFLKSLFPGDELKGLRAALYMLAPIKDFSAIGMLLYIAFAIKGSAYQPEGGAIKAAEAFEEAARRNGVDLQYRKKVAKILVEQGRAHGVRLEDGETVEAGCVVSAADLRQTCDKLLDATLVPADFKKKLEDTPLSGTFVIVSLVTNIDPATYGLELMDAFFTDTADIDTALTPDDPEHSLISIQFPEFRTESSDKHLFGVQLVAPASFEHKDHWESGEGEARGEEYRKLKDDFASRMLARIEKYLPGLSEHVVSRDIATPLTLQRYTLNDGGAAVGWSYTSTQRWKQKAPFVEGLYFAGHWVGPSGIYNVAVSGRNAAELVRRGKH